MKHDCFFYPLKLTLGFLIFLLVALLLNGCGSLVRVAYRSPDDGTGSVEFTLPKKGCYAK